MELLIGFSCITLAAVLASGYQAYHMGIRSGIEQTLTILENEGLIEFEEE